MKRLGWLLLLAACDHEPIGPVSTEPNGVTVALMATVEGCNVYKINTGGEVIYTTICPNRQEVAWSETRSTGKTAYTADYRTETVAR